jgi:hypothetical protein
MRRKPFVIIVFIILGLPALAGAQAWLGILNSTRAANWQRANVGVPGGIPSATWTQCGATIAPYTGTDATITNAIAACGPNTYVLLGAGTFNLSSGIKIQGQSNVVLRGSGPNATTLAFTAGTACISGAQNICVINSNTYYPGSGNTLPPCGGSNSTACANWTAGFAQGATSITLANIGAFNISIGDMIALDRQNDITDTGGEMICDSGPASATDQFGATWTAPSGSIIESFACHQVAEISSLNGRVIGGIDYSQMQLVRVTGVTAGGPCPCSGAGPFTFTISPGLYANNWSSSNPVGVFFVKPVSYVGVENLTIDNTNGTARSNFGIYNVDSWWIRNVRSIKGNRNHIWTLDATHGEVRDSYFFGTANSASQSYGIELYGSDNLIENNIWQQIASPFIGGGTDSGNVYGYNFAIDDLYAPPSWMQASYPAHDAGNSFNLYEGNQLNGFNSDNIHGNSALDTLFRNRMNGLDYNTCTYSSGGCINANTYNQQPTQQTVPIELDARNRGLNIIGNVLGTPGYHILANGPYEAYVGGPTASQSQCNHAIYVLGFSGGICDTLSDEGAPDDLLVRSTLMRWGNYDTISGSVRWNSTEASPAAATYIAAQTVPGSQTLPPSFYYPSTTKPPFFSPATPWPPIGPDVSGGTGPGGYSYNIPAAYCYYTVLSGPTDGSGSVLPFDANVCYPAPPPSVSAAAH